MNASIYTITCTGCGAVEEKRVEGDTAPVFNPFRARTVIENGVRVPRSECPLCGGLCRTSTTPTT